MEELALREHPDAVTDDVDSDEAAEKRKLCQQFADSGFEIAKRRLVDGTPRSQKKGVEATSVVQGFLR